jgi:hypothetical protein
MTQALGSNVQIGYQEETAYATDPVAASMQKLHYISESLRLQYPLLFSQTIQSNRNPSTPIRDNKTVEGNITCELQAYIGTLLKAILGSVSTAGSDPYTHTITIGSSVPSLVIEKGFTDLGTPEYFKYNGCKINRASLQIRANGFQQLSMDFIGAKETIDTSPFDATLTDSGKKAWSGYQIASITEGGGAIANVLEADINIENNLDGGIYCIGGAGLRSALPEGLVKVSGTIKALFENLTLYNKALGSTESSLAITYTFGTGAGSAGNEQLAITIPELQYGAQTPVVSGPAGLLVELPFEAYYDDGAGASAINMVLKNTIATL